jgi:uncharacterized membrane protein
VTVLTTATALGSGLVGGTFMAFSTFVMPALKRLPTHEGIAAMQALNVTAVQPPFMVPFIGTALLSVATIATGIADGDGYRIGGGASYLLGAFGLTIAYHVPRNDALDQIDPTAPDSAAHWQRYLREWIPGNHVRTLAGLAGAALLTVATNVQ